MSPLPHPPGTSRMLHGVDVSDRQGAVDWAGHARAGVTFAFARATDGEEGTDRWFARNWAGMRESWLVCGAYHVARPRDDPAAQARHLLRVADEAGGLRRGDLLALDLRTSDGLPPARVAAFARRWCAEVRAACGVRPFVHTHLAFALEGNCAGLGGHPLWISSPSRPPGDPVVPGPWTAWSVHQYAHSPIDLDVFAGTRQELTDLGLDPR